MSHCWTESSRLPVFKKKARAKDQKMHAKSIYLKGSHGPPKGQNRKQIRVDRPHDHKVYQGPEKLGAHQGRKMPRLHTRKMRDRKSDTARGLYICPPAHCPQCTFWWSSSSPLRWALLRLSRGWPEYCGLARRWAHHHWRL